MNQCSLHLYFIQEVNSTQSCMLLIQRTLARYIYMGKEKILKDMDLDLVCLNPLKISNICLKFCLSHQKLQNLTGNCLKIYNKAASISCPFLIWNGCKSSQSILMEFQHFSLLGGMKLMGKTGNQISKQLQNHSWF